MKRRTITILTVISVVMLAVPWHRIILNWRANRFLSEATVILSTGSEDPGIMKIGLKSGDSFRALLEHGCCSGAGFDAVAIQTSDGALFHSRNNYCGAESFFFEMTEHEFESLPALEKYLLENGYTKIRQNTGRKETASTSPAT
jgi:hypothetical protein